MGKVLKSCERHCPFHLDVMYSENAWNLWILTHKNSIIRRDKGVFGGTFIVDDGSFIYMWWYGK
jgi:hypothetical protein